MKEQLHRNLFWDCYVHDRYSSGILGRPFAIAENEIKVDLPLEVEEEQILLSGCQDLSQVLVEDRSIPNEVSIFRFVIRLRRLTSRCQARFFSQKTKNRPRANPVISAGEVLKDLEVFLGELTHCQQTAPFFLQPSSLYQRSEWHQFMVEKDRLTMIRGAFANLQSCKSNLPQKLLITCLGSGTRVIELYTSLFAIGAITWTRSYFQILFTSGLSIMYAISQLRLSASDNQSSVDFQQASRALAKCSDLLSKFVSEMSDARRFAVVFEALSKQYIQKDQHPTSQPSTDTPQQFDHGSSEPSAFNALNGTDSIRFEGPAFEYRDQDHAYDTGTSFDLDFSNTDDWLLFPTSSDTFLSQMEAGIGQYAWGTLQDANAWQNY